MESITIHVNNADVDAALREALVKLGEGLDKVVVLGTTEMVTATLEEHYKGWIKREQLGIMPHRVTRFHEMQDEPWRAKANCRMRLK
jgi:hypothetical protein